MKRVNKQFNRLETTDSNHYLTDFGSEFSGESDFQGYVKCKLIHARWGSIILPDQIFLGNDATSWVQPLAFSACVLTDLGEGKLMASLYVDISCGHRIRITFEHDGFISKGRDGSELFQCQIKGPQDLEDYATGVAHLEDGVPSIQLFHHTTDKTKPMIEDSGNFRGSPWNIQGNKKLTNVSFAYFTCLDSITTRADLTQIAMANDGKIYLMVDGFNPPADLTPRTAESKYANEILTLEVYREDTANRTATLKAWVKSEDLASQHLLYHRPTSAAAYYEVCRPSSTELVYSQIRCWATTSELKRSTRIP